MLPTSDKEAPIRESHFAHNGRELHVAQWQNCKPQHLYFVSDRDIKAGDWIYFSDTNKITQSKSDWTSVSAIGLFRVEASTATELTINLGHLCLDQIPQIPDSFVETFVQAKGEISEVEVNEDLTVIIHK